MNAPSEQPKGTETPSESTPLGQNVSAPTIPDHQLLQRIGGGSYGEVWLTRNALAAYRAAKIIHRKRFEDSRPFEREFNGLLKFEPISRSHEGLVDILQVGRQEDYFYYVMELADDANAECKTRSAESLPDTSGRIPHSALRTPHSYAPRTLRSLLRPSPQPSTLNLQPTAGRLPADQCVQIGLALTSGLAHLHKHGLVHRDIKPSNIIFVRGAPKLADIGLVTDADTTLSYVGTEGYIPPEGPGAVQADIFSLGKVFYEMATGQDRRQFPDLPPNLNEWSDKAGVLELNEVILKACLHDSHQRYQSADEMHADLALLQRGQSVKERRVWQQRIHALRRIGVAVTVVFLVATGVTVLWQTLIRHDPPAVPAVNEDGTAGDRNPKAAEAYSLGLTSMRRGTVEAFRQARENFTAAIDADPKFVAAHARLFEIYLMSEDHGIAIIAEKTERLNKLSAKLFELDPTNAETYATLAIVRFVNDWKWSEAEAGFKRALNVDPKCRMALVYYGYFLTRLGRADEARPVLERARKLDPASPLITTFLGHCEFVQRHYEQALTFYLRASEREPSYPSGHYWAGRVYVAMTNYSQALDEFKQHEINQGFDRLQTEQRYKNFRAALENGGPRGYWTIRIERAKDDEGWTRTPYRYAECYARLGDKAKALTWLEKALADRDFMENLLADEFWDGFRDEPKFKEMLKTVGLGSEGR